MIFLPVSRRFADERLRHEDFRSLSGGGGSVPPPRGRGSPEPLRFVGGEIEPQIGLGKLGAGESEIGIGVNGFC